MDRFALGLAALLLGITLSGCLGGSSKPSGRAALDYPPGWDTDAPQRSLLATEAYYPLDHSSTFLVKGAQYGRYIVRVAHRLENTQIFFSTGNQYTQAPGPNIGDSVYHFEFMQVRPLGAQQETVATNAAAQFSYVGKADQFTLTYLYGKGANYQYLAPYQGDPNHWVFEPGFYEFVVATDERLTIGINVRTGSDYWSTFYHPQELGDARAEALDHSVQFYTGTGGRMPSIDEERHALARAHEGETLNYFAFADVQYLTSTLALGADGTATVVVDGQETSQRMQINNPGARTSEAYAFAVDFNDPGPLRRELRVHATFQEVVSLESSMASILFLFAVALHPTLTLAGIPTAHAG